MILPYLIGNLQMGASDGGAPPPPVFTAPFAADATPCSAASWLPGAVALALPFAAKPTACSASIPCPCVDDQ